MSPVSSSNCGVPVTVTGALKESITSIWSPIFNVALASKLDTDWTVAWEFEKLKNKRKRIDNGNDNNFFMPFVWLTC